MKDILLNEIDSAINAITFLKQNESQIFIQKAACMIADTFENGRKILIAGNGGSLCDAMHFAEELTGFFRGPRGALPALVLSEVGHMSCVSNDIGYQYVFSRGVEAFGKEGDIFISLTTSGNSDNLLLALNKAKEKKLKTISFLGKTGGKMIGQSDLEWIVKNFSTSDRIQEAHMCAIHIIIHLVEGLVFEKRKKNF